MSGQRNRKLVIGELLGLAGIFVGLMVELVSAEFGFSQSYKSYLPAISHEITDLKWTEVGVPNVIEATFEIDPNHQNTIYVGSGDFQGAWRSLDGGQSWEVVGNGFPVTSTVRYIKTAPTSPTFIFVGLRFLKPFRTWNAGGTWETGNRPHSYPISALGINPVTPTTVFWGNGVWDSPTVGGEVFRSPDGGTNWSEILPLGTMAIEIVVDPQNPNVVYIGSSYYGLLKSYDGGDSWQFINNGLPSGDLAVRNIILHPDDSQIIYITADNKLYRSLDGGGNWVGIGFGLPVPWMSTLVMNPNSPEMMFATLVEGSEYYGVYQSMDGGISWRWIAPNPVNHRPIEMKIQGGAHPSLLVLFDGYSNFDDRLWKLDLVP